MSQLFIKELSEKEVRDQYDKKLIKLKSRSMISVADILYENQEKEMPIMEICHVTGLVRKKVIEVVGKLKRRHGFMISNTNYKDPRYKLIGFSESVSKKKVFLKPKLNPLIEHVFC